MIGHCGRVFRRPSVHDIAEYLQMNPAVDLLVVHDVIVVGAGSAGLSAATYAAVGDVRSGNVKRIASAVGAGPICVQMPHRVLAET